MSKRRMGASNGARSTCCLPKPPAFKASGRRSALCRVIRSRQVKKNAEWQKPQHEVVYLVSSLPAAASPQALLGFNRDHWRIEIMHRNKDVILGEDGYTIRRDNAPRNIFSLTDSFSKS